MISFTTVDSRLDCKVGQVERLGFSIRCASNTFVPISLLCWPLFVPQIEGGAHPDGLDTEKLSVKQAPAKVLGVPAMSGCPYAVIIRGSTEVDGPDMINWSKSSLSWQILSLQGQTVATQEPASFPADSKYVQFSDRVPPHLTVTKNVVCIKERK